MGEFLNVWESRITQAKVVAEDLFSEPIDLGELSFEELKSLWQETVQGYDLFIPFLKRQDPNLTLSEVQKLIPEGEKAEFDKADDAADQLLPLLEKVLIRYSAENILKFQLSNDRDTQSELDVRYKRLDAAIKDVKAKYSQ